MTDAKKRAVRVFLLYAREDDEFARKLTSDLAELGIDSWLDQTNLRPGDNWKLAIQNAIKNSDYVLALLSVHSMKSNWVWKAAEAALRDHPEGRSRVVPVLLNPRVALDVPKPLNKIKWLDLSGQDAYFANLSNFTRKATCRTPDTPSTALDFARDIPIQKLINVEELAIRVADEMESRMIGKRTEFAHANSSGNFVFVICAFHQDMDPIFEGIDAAAKQNNLIARRMKDIIGDYRITDKIIQSITESQLIVADLTHERPNVYFELGYARGLKKTIITIAREGTALHFDVKDWTCTFYSDSRVVERRLKERFAVELARVGPRPSA